MWTLKAVTSRQNIAKDIKQEPNMTIHWIVGASHEKPPTFFFFFECPAASFWFGQRLQYSKLKEKQRLKVATRHLRKKKEEEVFWLTLPQKNSALQPVTQILVVAVLFLFYALLFVYIYIYMCKPEHLRLAFMMHNYIVTQGDSLVFYFVVFVIDRVVKLEFVFEKKKLQCQTKKKKVDVREIREGIWNNRFQALIE